MRIQGIAGVLLAVTMLLGCSKQGKIERHLERGNEYFEAEQYEEATLEYLNVLREDRSNAVAIVNSGLAHYELGNAQQAGALLREAVKLDPDNLEIRQKLGTIYRLARMIPEARAEALEVLQRDPDNLEALLLLVDTSYLPEEVADLESRLVERAELFQDNHKYHMALAQVQIRKRLPEEAEASLNRALELAPEDVQLLQAMADFKDSLGEREEAEDFLRRAAEAAEPVSETRVKWAALRYAKGEKEEAVQSLQEMVAEDPDFLPAWGQLGELALRERRPEDCQEAVDAILEIHPQHFTGRLLQARLWLAQGESAKAVELLEDLSEQNETSGTLKYQLGLAYLRDGKLDQAKAGLREAVTLEPRLVKARLQLAELDLRTGQASTAITDLEELIGNQGGFPEAMMVLARAYLANNEPERAIATFSGLEEMQPESHVGPYLRGEVLLRQKRNREAREAYEVARERAPDLVAIVARLAVLDLREDNSEAAIARVKAAIEKQPDQAGLHQMLGVIYAQTDQLELAEQAFRKEIEIAPQSMTPYLSLTKLLVQLDRVDEALAQVEEGLAVEPDNLQTLMLSGMFYEQKDEYAKALERYNRIIELEPRFAQAMNNAAYVYAERMGDLDKAFELAKQAREQAPKDAAIADTLGWIAYLRGDYPWARTLILEAAEEYAEHPEVLYHVGMAELAMGDEAKARVALAKAAELGADSLENVAEVRGLAELLAVPAGQMAPEHRALLDAVLAADNQNPAARLRLAALAEEPAAARTLYEEILARYPQYLPATLRLIDLLEGDLGDRAEAFALAKQAREDWPRDPEVAKRAGWLAFQEGDVSWANSLLQESARLLPKDPEVSYRLAVVVFHAGNIAEAKRLAEGVVNSAGTGSSEREAAKRLLALAKAATGDVVPQPVAAIAQQVGPDDPLYVPARLVMAREQAAAEAVATYLDVLARAPTFAPAAREAARLYAGELGDSEKAFPLATQAREALPDDPVVAQVLGRLVYEREDYGYAVQLLEQALKANSKDAESLYLLGLSRQEQGDAKGARTALERALELDPASDHAAKAKQVIAEAE